MSRPNGFTLIELLVVIAILSLLVVAFAPDILGSKKQGDIAATQALLIQISTGVKAFETEYRIYPPDNLEDPNQDPATRWQLKKDQGTNTASESLVVFLTRQRALDLAEMQQSLSNTDGDDNGMVIPGLGRSARVELVDNWGTPIAYFSSTGSGFAQPQKIQLAVDQGGATVEARAWKNGEEPLARKFVLRSAGPDREFNTDDDITFPQR
jgi:prepilin-type N-terminal cleavage/methylation domain-containing protein